MPLELVLEDGTGVADANSYVELAEADALHALRFHHEDWSVLDPEDRKLALVDFFSRMQAFPWKGEVAVFGQPNAFPRKWLPKANRECEEFDADEIPQFVKDGQCEGARWVALSNLDDVAGATAGAERSVKIGEMASTYDSATQSTTAMPPAVLRLFAPYLRTPRAERVG